MLSSLSNRIAAVTTGTVKAFSVPTYGRLGSVHDRLDAARRG